MIGIVLLIICSLIIYKFLDKLDMVAIFLITSYFTLKSALLSNLNTIPKLILMIFIGAIVVGIYYGLINVIWNYAKILYIPLTIIASTLSSIVVLMPWFILRDEVLPAIFKNIETKNYCYIEKIDLTLPWTIKNPTANLIFWLALFIVISFLIFKYRIGMNKLEFRLQEEFLSKKRREEMIHEYTEEEYKEYKDLRDEYEDSQKRFQEYERRYREEARRKANEENENIDTEYEEKIYDEENNRDPKGYYRILGITYKATDEEIHKAYKKSMSKYHPDKNLNTNSHDIAIKINEAYEILKDKNKRDEYDRFGTTL